LTSYYSGQPLSLEAQANQSQAPAPEATPESRDQNRAVITEWESSAPQREAQVADLTSQIREIQAAKDAMATAPIDPLMPEDQFLAQLREEEERYAEQEEELQREIERLTKPSAEYLEAQRLEDELTAKEAAINAGVNRTTAEIADQPIPYGFVTGQSAAVERRANADLQTIAAQKIPLQQRLANEQARRAAALDVVKTSSTRAINRRDTASDRRFDYQTDEKKRKEDRVDQAQKDRYVSVGDGSQLYDTVTGKVVSNNPKNFSPNSSSSSTDTTDAGVNGLIRGNDGYVDPYEYAKLRAQAKSANEFDRKYSYLMNPVSRPKFGLGESGA
jgi:phage host-nuclease inhibitor protein Gam